MEDQGNAGLPAALAPQTLSRSERPAGGQVPMRRREFITLLGGAAAAWPLAARAQQRAFPVIGLLSSRSPAVDTPFIAVIRQGLNEIGLVEGQNIALDYRWADGQYDRLAGLASDLVRRQVAVIITMGSELSGLAAKARSEEHTSELQSLR